MNKGENNVKDLHSKHVFICVKEKEAGVCCGGRGSNELAKKLKKWARDEGLKPDVRVNYSLCLGQCEKGIAIVKYPKGEWLLDVKTDDFEKVKAFIEED